MNPQTPTVAMHKVGFRESEFSATSGHEAVGDGFISGDQMSSTRCPSCGSSVFAASETHSPAFTTIVNNRSFVQPAYRVRCCSNCGLYYKTERLVASALAEYYDVVDFRKWEIPGYFPTERAALRFLRRLPPGSNLLDYGCSTGRLLAGLTSHYHCYGYEINAKAAREASAKGLRMLTAKELGNYFDAFDAVILVDVFEHLVQPVETLNELCGYLKPGGRLVLVTGNADAPACKRNPALFWYFLNVEHLCMLSRRHATFLENKLGLKLELWRALCHYDVSIKGRLLSHIWSFAFWGSQPDAPCWLRYLLGRAPVLKKAKSWTFPLGFAITRDHVLAVFRKA